MAAHLRRGRSGASRSCGAAIDVVARKGYETTTAARRRRRRRAPRPARSTTTSRTRTTCSHRRSSRSRSASGAAWTRRWTAWRTRASGCWRWPTPATPTRRTAVANQVVWTEFWVRASRSEQLRDLHERPLRRLAPRASRPSCAPASPAAPSARSTRTSGRASSPPCSTAWRCTSCCTRGALGAAGMASSSRAFVTGTLDAAPQLAERHDLAAVDRAVDRLEGARLPDRLVAPDEHARRRPGSRA